MSFISFRATVGGVLYYALIGALGASFVAGLLLAGGWVVRDMWAWFVVPALGVPALSLPHAVGLDVLFTFMVGHPIRGKKEETTHGENLRWLGKMFARPLVTYVIGYLVHLWAVAP